MSLILAILFLSSLLLPSVTQFSRGLRTSWLLFVIWVAVLLLEQRGRLDIIVTAIEKRKSTFGLLFVWTLIILVNMVLGRGYTGSIHLMSTITLAMLVLLEVSHTSLDDGSYDRIVYILIILLGIETARSIPTLWSEPLLARAGMSVNAPEALREQAAAKGVGEYTFYTGIAIALPYLLAKAWEAKCALRLVLILCCLAMASSIALATFAGAILLMIAGFALLAVSAVVYSRNKVRTAIGFGALAGIALFVWSSWIAPSQQGAFVLDKLRNQSTSISESGLVEGDITLRADLARISIYTILEHPLFGVGPSTGAENRYLYRYVGGHSSWLDLPAEFGLLGAGVYFALLFSLLARPYHHFRARRALSAVDISVLARMIVSLVFVIGGSYNPVTGSGPIMSLVVFICLGGIILPELQLAYGFRRGPGTTRRVVRRT